MEKPPSKRGGSRPNTGGARPGSGRKPNPPLKSRSKRYETDSADEFLTALMNDPRMLTRDRIVAARALAKCRTYQRPPGKKELAQQAAERVVRRSLTPSPPPSKGRHLRVVK